MPATSATHMIFFIAAVIIAIGVVSAIVLVTDGLKDALESRASTEQSAIRSRVEVVNDLVAMPYNNTSKTLDVYVKNIGTTRLDPQIFFIQTANPLPRSFDQVDIIGLVFCWGIHVVGQQGKE